MLNRKVKNHSKYQKPFSFLGIIQPAGRVLSAMVGRGSLSEIIADNGDWVEVGIASVD